MTQQQNDEDMWAEIVDLLMEGGTLSNEALSLSESALLRDPESLHLRAKLAAHYGRVDPRHPRLRDIGLWLMEHHPQAHPAVYSVFGPAFHALSDPESYFVAEALWQTHVEHFPNDVHVLMNAISFFHLLPATADELHKRCIELDPENVFHKLSLLEFRKERLKFFPAAERKILALESLQYFDSIEAELRADYAAGDADPPPFDAAARFAFAAEELARAEAYANEVLRIADWPYFEDSTSEAHQGAHNLLGLIALRRGDRQEALRRLSLSASVHYPPSRPPWTYPDCELAQALLELGEREAVIAFLARYPSCKFAGNDAQTTAKLIHQGLPITLSNYLLPANFLISDGMTLAVNGKRERAERKLHEARAVLTDEMSIHWSMAALEAALGKDDEALGSLERALRIRPALKQELMKTEAFQSLRKDPRFWALAGLRPEDT